MSKYSTKTRQKVGQKARIKSPKVHFNHNGKNMTSKAGLIPVIKFIDHIGFSKSFKQTVKQQRARNSLYSLEQSVFLIMTGIIGGAFNISKCVPYVPT